MEPTPAMHPISSADDIARGRIVPWIIAAFYISFIVPLLVFTWIAFQHKPDMVTEHAYDKGLAYNRALDTQSAMLALGWSAQLSFDGHALTMTLTGKEGTPLSGAAAQAWLIRPADASLDQTVPMREVAAGRYEAIMPHPAPGLWQMRATVEYHGEQLQTAREFSVR